MGSNSCVLLLHPRPSRPSFCSKRAYKQNPASPREPGFFHTLASITLSHMADPITTILTTAVEHAPSTAAVTVAFKAAKDFLAKVAGPAVEEFAEIGRDYVKGWRAKNSGAVLAGADKLLAEAGREPQAVPLKTLLPLLDAASLEDNPTLAERWATLLANAADPAQRIERHPAYTDMLKQITAAEAELLDELFSRACTSHGPKAPLNKMLEKEQYRRDATTSYMLQLNTIFSIRKRQRRQGKSALELGDRQEFDKMIDNLLRQQILVLAKEQPNKGAETFSTYKPDRSTAFFTSLGYDFMLAVTPPAS
jgi:hypothetical protein